MIGKYPCTPKLARDYGSNRKRNMRQVLYICSTEDFLRLVTGRNNRQEYTFSGQYYDKERGVLREGVYVNAEDYIGSLLGIIWRITQLVGVK